MKYLLFNRESNKFDDILKDARDSKLKFKISFLNHLMLGFHDDKVMSLFTLRYGTDVIEFSHITPDRSPIMNRDYIPKNKPVKWPVKD